MYLNDYHLTLTRFTTVTSQLTLSANVVIGIGEVESVESSSARPPPPAPLQHGRAVEARPVVVTGTPIHCQHSVQNLGNNAKTHSQVEIFTVNRAHGSVFH